MNILRIALSLTSLFSLVSAFGLRGSGVVSDCNPTSLFHFDSATLEPTNPLPDTNITLSLNFTNSYSVVTDGNVDYLINFNGLPYSYTEPLCTPSLPCPIELGTHTVYSEPINPGTSAGKLSIQANYKDLAENSLLCVKTVIRLFNTANQKALIVVPTDEN
ncbi:MAG: hypothetical protein EBT86_03935 [Actinobacteria bacterium]|nr:hypothetical protein [Actinomycetota bacterium]